MSTILPSTQPSQLLARRFPYPRDYLRSLNLNPTTEVGKYVLDQLLDGGTASRIYGGREEKTAIISLKGLFPRIVTPRSAPIYSWYRY
jgi:hypothetical protein